MKRSFLPILLSAPFLILMSCSGDNDPKFPDFAPENQQQAEQIYTKLVSDCSKLAADSVDETESIWSVPGGKADAFCDCVSTKAVSNISEDKLESALNDVKRAGNIPMLPVVFFAGFGDEAKATIEACK